MLPRSSRSVLRKCVKNEIEDRINGLPDEIIVEILCLLPFKEAVATSILSHRWRHLWTFITSNLSFDLGKQYNDVLFYEDEFIRNGVLHREKFVAWVNNVLRVHQGTTVIEQFRVRFFLDVDYSSELDSWVKFAADKRVQTLELILSNTFGDPYCFPSVEKLKQYPLCFSGLADLCLICVGVTEEVIEYVLANCPLLEQLCIEGSYTLANLKICGDASLKLKHLVLYRCSPLEILEISAPNLVSFTYTGPKSVVPFKNVPLLSELCLGDEYCYSFIYEASQHTDYLSQLQKLTLIIPHKVHTEGLLFSENFPKLFNLKELELRIALDRGLPLICFSSLIKAAPSLSKFVLKLMFIEALPPKLTLLLKELGKWHRRNTKHKHKCLKWIEIVGFIGHQTDYQLALHLLKIAKVSLEKIMIDTRRPISFWGPHVNIVKINPNETQIRQAERKGARKCARKLLAKLPAGAELVIV